MSGLLRNVRWPIRQRRFSAIALGSFINEEARSSRFVGSNRTAYDARHSNKGRCHPLLFGGTCRSIERTRLLKPMKSSKVILAVGFAIGLVSLAGCAGKTRYPSYYVLD